MNASLRARWSGGAQGSGEAATPIGRMIRAHVSDATDRDDALGANRQGRMSPAQLSTLRAGMQYKHSGLWGRLTRGFDPLVKDADAGRVEAIEGAISKRRRSNEDPFNVTVGTVQLPTHLIAVANDQGNEAFLAPRDLFDAAPSAGYVRLFYLPVSRHAINFEMLERPPREEVSQAGVRTEMKEAGRALLSLDRGRMAEAAAEMASMEHAMEPFRGEGAPPPISGSDARPLGEAIVGTWTSPFITVTCRDDGTLTFQVAAQEPQQGTWSVGADGRLHAEMMGASQSAEASIADDWLTIGLDGQWLKLQRSAPS